MKILHKIFRELKKRTILEWLVIASLVGLALVILFTPRTNLVPPDVENEEQERPRIRNTPAVEGGLRQDQALEDSLGQHVVRD